MSAVHTRPRRGRPIGVPIAAGLLALTLGSSGCSILQGENGSEELDRFVSALSEENVTAASELTSDPAAAAKDIAASLDGMGGPDLTVRRTDPKSKPNDRPAALELTWSTGADRAVTTTGEAQTTKVGDSWKVVWNPKILDNRIIPGGHLALTEDLDYATNIVDRTGAALMSWTPVTAVTLAPDSGASAEALASALSGPVPGITAQSIRDGLGANPGSSYVVASLRPSDIGPIRERLAGIAGVTLPEQGRLIADDRSLSSPALAGLPDAWLSALKEKGGWSAAIDNPGQDPIPLGGAPRGEVPDLVSTLQVSIQRAALDAVNSTGLAASIVAIQPSTGGVLAVAQNSAANAQGAVALEGQFPPGSTFKTITTAAALQAGVVQADSTVQCPGTVTVSGRTIPNEDSFVLGPVPLSTAFAQSCNTSQALISDKLSPEAMRDTAAQLGLGVDFATPGLRTITGSVPVTEPGPARVEAAIGQGTVLASPFGMAVMEASLGNGGRMVLPSILSGRTAVANVSPPPLSTSVVDTLRSFMVQTVRSGTATGASSIEGLGGKTGTAEVAGKAAHGWFVGTVGDLSFAVLIEEAGSSKPAVSLAANFLRAAGQPAPIRTG